MDQGLKRKAVYCDHDDNVDCKDSGSSYLEILRSQFNSIYGENQWTEFQDEVIGTKKKFSCVNKDHVADDKIFSQSVGFLEKLNKNDLTANEINYQRLKNLNACKNSEGLIIRHVMFNKYYKIALVSGNSTVAALYAVDGENNECIHSINLENFLIFNVSFTNRGNEIIFGSNKNHCIIYDMMSSKPRKIKLPSDVTVMKKFKVSPDDKYIAAIGKCSEIHLFSSTTKELIHTFRQNSNAHNLAFTADSKYLVSNSETAEVTIWDINKRSFFHRWYDDGCLHGSVLDISSSNQFLATGSCEGIVNLYERHAIFQQQNPQPVKIFKNLSTRISSLLFNPTSEVLAFASSIVPDAIKLANVSSKQVFQNFHLNNNNNYVKFHCVRDVDFSPSSGYMAIAKINPNVELFRLFPYANY